MSKKYPELEEYGFSEDIILELEKVVQRSCRKDRKVAVKELNALLLGNDGDDSEIDALGIDLWFIVKDIDVINKIPKTVKEFKDLELDFKNASNQQLMEFMIRVGNYTQIKNSIMDNNKDINLCFSCMNEKCDFINDIINKEFNITIDVNCGLNFIEIEGNDNLVAEALDDDGETCEIDQYDDEHDELLCINTLDDLVDAIEKELNKK